MPKLRGRFSRRGFCIRQFKDIYTIVMSQCDVPLLAFCYPPLTVEMAPRPVSFPWEAIIEKEISESCSPRNEICFNSKEHMGAVTRPWLKPVITNGGTR